jgi:hypothetical protein
MHRAADNPDVTSIYNRAMAAKPKAKPRARPKGPWTAEEVARNERVAKIRVQRDRARGVSANLEDVVAHTRFANRFAEAFRDARRA